MLTASSNAMLRGGLLSRAMESAASNRPRISTKRTGKGIGCTDLVLYVAWVGAAKSQTQYHSFRVSAILPFANKSTNDKLYEVAEDGSAITFYIGGGETHIIENDTSFFISLPYSATPSPASFENTWCKFTGVSVSQSASGGRVFLNINAESIEPWLAAPNQAQMFDVFYNAYGPTRSNLKPVDRSLFPDLSVREERDAINMDESLSPDARKEALKTLSGNFQTCYEKALVEAIVELNATRKDDPAVRYFSQLFDKKIDSLKRGTTPQRLLVIPFSNNARELAMAIDAQGGYGTLTSVLYVEWAESMFNKKDDGSFTQCTANERNHYTHRPEKKQILIRAAAQAVVADEVNKTTHNLQIQINAWNDTMMSPFGIYHPTVGEALFMPKLAEMELILTATGNGFETYGTNCSSPDTSALCVTLAGAYLDYKHFLNKVCCRVTPSTANTLFRYWINRQFKSPVTSNERLNINDMLDARNVSPILKSDWKFYLTERPNGTLEFINQDDKLLINMMGSKNAAIQISDMESGLYTFFVFYAGNKNPDSAAIFDAHSSLDNTTHLEMLSADITKFCTTGVSEHFVPLKAKDDAPLPPIEFQIYAVDTKFLHDVIMKPYVIPQLLKCKVMHTSDLQQPTCSSSTEWVGRASSDLLVDDQGVNVRDIIYPPTDEDKNESEGDEVVDDGVKTAKKPKGKRTRR